MPARLDAVLGQLERGELVVRTESTDPVRADDSGLGYAVLSSAFVISSAVVVTYEPLYAAIGAAFALWFLALYVRNRLDRTKTS